MDIHKLNERFAIHDGLKVAPGFQGDPTLPIIEIETPHGTGKVAMQGGHILHWQPKNQEPVLFVSQKAKYAPGVAIRGGIPVCFPWFGPAPVKPWVTGKLPAHGVVRTRMWELEATRQGEGKIALVLLFKSNEETKRIWPFDFELRLRLTFGTQLIIKLEVKNTGTRKFEFQEALHSYFRVGDVRQVQVWGLENHDFYDQLAKMEIRKETQTPAITKQIDRIYITPGKADHSGTMGINDPVLKRKIQLDTLKAHNAVLWNPGSDKVLTFSDMAAEEWPAMLCIETANIRPQEITLEPGSVHQMRLTLNSNRY